MDRNIFFIVIIVLIIITVAVVCYNYAFEKKITTKLCRSGFKKRQFGNIELLYNSYKSINKNLLIIAKLELQSKETSSSFIKDTFNLFISIFTGVFLVVSTLLITTSTGMLNFVYGNEELKKDMSSWLQSVNGFSKSIADGMKSMLLMVSLVCISAYIFMLCLLMLNHKKNVIKKHLAIIEQVEKDHL